MIPDIDIILATDFFDGGATSIFQETLKALFTKLKTAIKRRRDDLLYKRPGSIASTFKPRLIWIATIDRPENADKKMNEAIVLIKKFNTCLQDLIFRLVISN